MREAVTHRPKTARIPTSLRKTKMTPKIVIRTLERLSSSKVIRNLTWRTRSRQFRFRTMDEGRRPTTRASVNGRPPVLSKFMRLKCRLNCLSALRSLSTKLLLWLGWGRHRRHLRIAAMLTWWRWLNKKRSTWLRLQLCLSQGTFLKMQGLTFKVRSSRAL